MSTPCEERGPGRMVPGQRPQQANGPEAVFPRFPARGQKAVYGPRASGGGAPARRKPAPPARAEQGARGGRGRSAPARARRNSRGSTEPPASRGHARGRRISEGPTAGRGARRPPSGRPFNAAPTSDGGSGGPPSGRPSPSDEAPGRRARGHEERVERSEIALEKARQGVTIPFHPGAEKYLQEKGVK